MLKSKLQIELNLNLCYSISHLQIDLKWDYETSCQSNGLWIKNFCDTIHFPFELMYEVVDFEGKKQQGYHHGVGTHQRSWRDLAKICC